MNGTTGAVSAWHRFPLDPQWRARYGTPIQAQIADSVADAEMACRANDGVIL
jgi:hypothetical protein